MTWKNTYDNWGTFAKTLHWLIALLVIGMICVGFFMGDFPKAIRGNVYQIHKSIGITILFLMLIRIWWRLTNPTPKLPTNMPRWQQISAHASHGLIYLALVAMPLVGWAMSTAAGKPVNYFFLVKINMPFVPLSKPVASFFGDAHEVIAWIIVALGVLHILGALKHHFVNKDQVLRRMLKKV